ncbi:unnamed protein product [Rotaria sordida]|uniref:Aldehyde dehydrogenase domain-containing protein n=1 Tax=Rotaria sordida TaxID=392033 RepID=A0A820CCM5_9BILA|nr:unnamed protein product [Rotaria sordida]
MADVDKAVEGAQTPFDIESPWHKLDPLSFSQHKSICRKWKHLTMLIALKPTEQTPLSALSCTALIKEFGDKLKYGGERVDNKDYVIKATIFSGVKDDTQIAREEIFGPVMSVLKYDSYEEVIKRANDTTFGLGAAVTICDQALFDGFKESGQEKELGRYGLEAYYKVKTVVVKLV